MNFWEKRKESSPEHKFFYFGFRNEKNKTKIYNVFANELDI